jgi:thiol-disulfide isomerase/thioredoxin
VASGGRESFGYRVRCQAAWESETLNLKFKIGAFLLGGLLLGVLVGSFIFRDSYGSTGTRDRLLPPTVGSAAPDFELSNLDGAYQKLNSLKGEPVIINFWATWCAPCKDEMPLLERYGKKYNGKLVILGVNSEEKADVVKSFINEMGITFPILLDQSGIVSGRYFVKDFPYTFFVDADGVLRGQHIGSLTEDRLVKYLATIGIEQ